MDNEWLNALIQAAAAKQLKADVHILEEMVRESELTAQELQNYASTLSGKAVHEKFILCAAIARLKK